MKDFCRYAKKCNSCQLCNLSYEEQLEYKERLCRRLLGGLCRVERITESPEILGYRNKAQFVYKREGKRIVSGIYKSATHSVMAADSCAICSEFANRVSGELCRLFQSFKIAPYDPYTGRGWLRSVIIREARATGESMAVIIGADSIFPAKRTFATALKKACPELSTAVCAVNSDPDRLFGGRQTEVLFGDGKITDILCGERFIISASSFYQINRAQTERLYTKAIELAALTGGETVLDAYCGVGTIGITASRKAGRVLAVELNPEAIRNARSNAELNGIENISFTAADSRLYAKELQERGERVDVAFVDPPRAGCTAGFLKSLSRLSPERIVYISCNPETQARDIRVLGRLGYKAQMCYPFDMFPHTKHVETVVLLSRKMPDDKIEVDLDLDELDITSAESKAT